MVQVQNNPPHTVPCMTVFLMVILSVVPLEVLIAIIAL